jgi:hypothetical protein
VQQMLDVLLKLLADEPIMERIVNPQ